VRHVSLAEMSCPVARSLDIVGEWWTLLIVRDALAGARRFDDFRGTGIADNVLTARLKRLVAEGILERHPYQQRPMRHEYLLTQKGRALAPVLGALRAWGRQWTRGKDRSLRMVHTACGSEVALRAYCDECDERLTLEDLTPELRGGRARAGALTA